MVEASDTRVDRAADRGPVGRIDGDREGVPRIPEQPGPFDTIDVASIAGMPAR